VNHPPAAVRLAIAGRTSNAARIALAVVLCAAAAGCGQLPSASPATGSPSSIAEATVEASPAQPPVAWLSVPPAPRTAGALGSYTWLGAGSDSPWLPGAAVSLPRGATASVTFEPPVPAASWRVRRGTGPDEVLKLVAQGGAGPIQFVVPDAPTTIELAVDYGSAGSVIWYWAVTPAP
jgi:hypothetical protein